MTKEEILAAKEQIEKGDKVYFYSQKSPMTVKARSQRYLILTEPFYRNKTVYHSIVDFEKNWKAPNDRIVNPYNYEVQADIDECLVDIMTGKIGLSQKRGVSIDIDWEKTLAAKNKRKKK